MSARGPKGRTLPPYAFIPPHRLDRGVSEGRPVVDSTSSWFSSVVLETSREALHESIHLHSRAFLSAAA